jgi:hypothetical protein
MNAIMEDELNLTSFRFIDRTSTAATLNVTRGLMETVLSLLGVFDNLKDFIILFDRGEQSGQREMYPPACVYREFGARKHGFGIFSSSFQHQTHVMK